MPCLSTFAASDAYLGDRHKRNVNGIRSTAVERIDADTIGVRYHNSHVVLQHRDGTFSLAGWARRSRTTKERMNDFSPANIHQHDFVWYNRGMPMDGGWERVGADGFTFDHWRAPTGNPVDVTERYNREAAEE